MNIPEQKCLFSPEEQERELCDFIFQRKDCIRAVYLSKYTTDLARYDTYIVFQRAPSARVFHSTAIRINRFIDSESITLKETLILVRGLNLAELEVLRNYEIECLENEGLICLPGSFHFICDHRVLKTWGIGSLDDWTLGLPEEDLQPENL